MVSSPGQLNLHQILTGRGRTAREHRHGAVCRQPGWWAPCESSLDTASAQDSLSITVLMIHIHPAALVNLFYLETRVRLFFFPNFRLVTTHRLIPLLVAWAGAILQNWKTNYLPLWRRAAAMLQTNSTAFLLRAHSLCIPVLPNGKTVTQFVLTKY